MALSSRIRTIDESGRRNLVHPTEVRGFWHRRRAAIQAVLIVFFLAIPWIRVGGRPLLLLDIFDRRFFFFGVMFRAHDVPLLFLLVIGFILLFGWLTTLFGRVWCGWACPQTVFIEAVFRRIEGWCEGSAEERRLKANAPMDGGRLFAKIVKWDLYLVITLIITHSFLALFVGPEKLRQMIVAGPSESPFAFVFMVVSSATILFDFGWFREQFCIVVCPYGRIQSVFQDTRTLTVSYDAKRGEPRGNLKIARAGQAVGDCVDCLRCVRVCPTGVDIRDGSSQLECIACTACIDACDDVMGRLGRAKGLIRYASMEELEADARKPEPVSLRLRRVFLRGRGLAYAFLVFAVFAGLGAAMHRRGLADIEIFKNHGEPYAKLGDDRFANSFVMEVSSRSVGDSEIRVELENSAESGIRLVMPNNPFNLPSDGILREPISFSFERRALTFGKAKAKLRIEVTTKGLGPTEKSELEKEVTLVGPL